MGRLQYLSTRASLAGPSRRPRFPPTPRWHPPTNCLSSSWPCVGCRLATRPHRRRQSRSGGQSTGCTKDVSRSVRKASRGLRVALDAGLGASPRRRRPSSEFPCPRRAGAPAHRGQVAPRMRGAMRLDAQSCWSAAAAPDAVEPVPAAVGAYADGPVLSSDPHDGLGALCADARVRVEAGRSVSSIGHTSATLSVSLGPTEVVDVAALATGIRGWVGARWAPVDNGSVSGHPPPPTAASRCHGDGPSRWWQRPPAARRHARPRVDGGEAGWLP